MKKILSFVLVAGLTLTLWNCKKESTTQDNSNGFPDQIVVDIPDAISSTSQMKSGLAIDTLGCTSLDAIPADSVYWNVRGFIWIGEFSADIVQEIIKALKKYNIDKPMEFEFTSNDDSKQKKVVVTADGIFNDITYDLKLVMTDVESGKTAMEIFWFKSKAEGFALLSPIFLDTKNSYNQLHPDLKYKVEYWGVKTDDYDKKMVVTLSGFTVPATDVFAMDNLKMAVTKKGDIVSISGNSNHPNAFFVDVNKKGFSYTFVANADVVKNVGVIDLALAPCTLDSTAVFTNYSVKNIIKQEVGKYTQSVLGLAVDDPKIKDCVDAYLVNLESPAYYDSTGYKSCGSTVPGTNFSPDVTTLPITSAFTPKEVNDLNLATEMAQ